MSGVDPERRGLLRGRQAALPFPPWAAADFTERCDRCNACIHACESGVLVRGDGGFPRIDFARAGCHFCAACVEVCEREAFDVPFVNVPWTLRPRLADGCLTARGVVCRACEDVCEAAAIRFRPQLGGRAILQIDTDACTGCGACVAACPVDVLMMEEAA
jgi:ferredoxin-type protein NapF